MEIEKDINYLRQFSYFFNRSYLFDFINRSDNRIKQTLLYTAEENDFLNIYGLSYEEIFDKIYSLLKKDYRCEYVYLNEIFINDILKNHDETHAIITELPVNNSQLDMLVVNGTTTAYEVKTELDTLSRLPKQIKDYSKAFDYIYVITSKEFLKEVRTLLREMDSSVGIYLLETSGELKLVRKSKSHKNKMDKNVMFKILNRKEFETLDTDYYKAMNKFLSLSNNKAHKFLKESLLSRNKDISYLLQMPESLRLATYKIQDRLNRREKKIFNKKITLKIEEEL